MKRYANAKVNLALDVLEQDANGYHVLDMIMAPIDLAEPIELEPADLDDHAVYFDGQDAGKNNTVYKALHLLEEVGLNRKYEVHVEKKIPMQAGLAGGSADAAAVLKAVNEAENLGLSKQQLREIGMQVGADVPFCLVNDWARVQGYGEKITPIDSDWQLEFLLVKPYQGISTPACFSKWDEMELRHYDIDIVQDAITNKSLDLLYQTMENALEACAMELEPTLQELKEKMLEMGLVRVMMTGSGSALMGFSVDHEVLEDVCEKLQSQVEFAGIVHAGNLEETR